MLKSVVALLGLRRFEMPWIDRGVMKLGVQTANLVNSTFVSILIHLFQERTLFDADPSRTICRKR